MESIGKRLESIRTNTGLNPRQFAIENGIDASQYTKAEKNLKGLGTEKLVELASKYKVDLQWLLVGETSRVTGDELRRRKAFDGRQQKGVIAVPIGAQAGYGKNYLDPLYLNQLERIIIPGNPYDGEEFRYFQVDGDSMEYYDANGRPDGLVDGMWVIAQKVPFEGWQFVDDYYVHVFVTESKIEIKRLFKKDDNTFVKVSDNELYPQKLQPIQELKELWIVKRKLDWYMPAPRPVEIKI